MSGITASSKVRKPVNSPKRHHYVPQMLLRRFTNENGRLHFFDKRIAEKGVMSATPDAIFFEKHLYSQYDKTGSKDVSVEIGFSTLEGKANNVIEKIIQAARVGKLPGLTPEEKRDWDAFFYYQWKRTPDSFTRSETLGNFESALDWAIGKFEREHRQLTPGERAEFSDPDTKKRLAHNARVKAIADPGAEVQRILATRGLGVVRVQKNTKSFVIGSFPIVRFGNGHLSDPKIEVWFPIASDVAVTPAPCPGDEERLLTMSNHHDIRAINRAIFKQSTLTAAASDKLIISLASQR